MKRLASLVGWQDVAAVAGAAFVGWGFCLVYPPLALFWAGAVLLAVGIRGAIAR